MVGVAAAISNAIFHAMGPRFRELPIRIEHLFQTRSPKPGSVRRKFGADAL